MENHGSFPLADDVGDLPVLPAPVLERDELAAEVRGLSQELAVIGDDLADLVRALETLREALERAYASLD